MKTKIAIKIIKLRKGSYDKWADMEEFKGLLSNNTLQELQDILKNIEVA